MKRDGHAHQREGRRTEVMSRWWVVLVLFLLIVVVCVLLWRFLWLRPYLAGIGAGLAAFLAPLPGLLKPETRGKWLISIGLACLIGLGTWYSTYEIQREKDLLEANRDRLEQRFQLYREAFEALLKKLPIEEQSKFLLSAQARLLSLYRQRHLESVVDLAQALAAVDIANGHALYFEGEAYRSLNKRSDMQEAFLKYLQVADHHAEARNGDAYQCSLSPSGYCGERTEWISHLIARNYLKEARSSRSAREAGTLSTAFGYERAVLKTRPKGFDRIDSVESSCELLQAIASELGGLGRRNTEVESTLQRYRARYGPCG